MKQMNNDKENIQQQESANQEVKAIVAQLNNIINDLRMAIDLVEKKNEEKNNDEFENEYSVKSVIVDTWKDKIEPLTIKLFKLKGVKVELDKIKLPLSEIDYLRIRGMDLLDNRFYWDYLHRTAPELNKAYDDMEYDIFYQNFPYCNACFEDTFWTKPRSITLDNVNEIEDPLAWWVALKYIIKEWRFDRTIIQSLQKIPELEKIIEEAKAQKQDS